MATRKPPVELFYDPEKLDPNAPRLRVELDRAVESRRWDESRGEGRRRIRVPSRYHHVFMPCRYRHDEAGEGDPVRGRAVELFYDPAELDPVAPRLRVGKNGGAWELRQDDGTLLSAHDSLPEAIDSGLVRSGECFSEILVRNSTGRQEWSVHHNPAWIDMIRWLIRTAPGEREAAA
jgi:hypothetical protein